MDSRGHLLADPAFELYQNVRGGEQCRGGYFPTQGEQTGLEVINTKLLRARF